MEELPRPSERTLDQRVQDLEDYMNANSPPPDEIPWQPPGDGFHGETYHHFAEVSVIGTPLAGPVALGLGIAALAGLVAAAIIFRNAARHGVGVK